MAIIEVRELVKDFRIEEKSPGFGGAIKDLFHRKSTIKRAVDHVSFDIEQGEIIGYVGPNGAGKSTTIKILCGILLPTSGKVEVAGIDPFKRRKENARRIGVVFGQRSQLWWDVPVEDTFQMLRYLYRVPVAKYEANVKLFRTLLGLDGFWKVPVRQLSLGQRMRAELAASLIHDPDILYMDEPTVGMDVVVKDTIREFIKALRRARGVTVILTTHDLRDVERLCSRIIIIDQGRLIYDGEVAEIKARVGRQRVLIAELEYDSPYIPVDGVETAKKDGKRLTLAFDRTKVSAAQIIARVCQVYPVRDLSLEDADIESVIKSVFIHGIVDMGPQGVYTSLPTAECRIL